MKYYIVYQVMDSMDPGITLGIRRAFLELNDKAETETGMKMLESKLDKLAKEFWEPSCVGEILIVNLIRLLA